ncbi:MAG: adenylate kinase [Alphaproteobacteria bacterium]
MIFLFFGPPGAGKGTQASILSKQYHIPHLSTGEILRNNLLGSDTQSIKIKKIIEKGDLVSDQILNEIIKQKLDSHECNNGYILDGYPRTLSQNDWLQNYFYSKNLEITKIFDIKLEKDIIVKRIKNRAILEKRNDDNEEVIKNRVNKYIEETKPLSKYYLERNPKNYHLINGNQEIEMIKNDILEIIKK